MFCTRCGTNLPEGAVFCHTCGMRAYVPLEASAAGASQTAPVVADPTAHISPGERAPPPDSWADPAFVKPDQLRPDDQTRSANLGGAGRPPILPGWSSSTDYGGQGPTAKHPAVSAPASSLNTNQTRGSRTDRWPQEVDHVLVVATFLIVFGGIVVVLGTFVHWLDLAPVDRNGYDMGYLTDPRNGRGADGLIALVVAGLACVASLHYFFTRSAWFSFGIMLLGLAAAAIAGYNVIHIAYSAKRELGVSTRGALDLIGTGLYLTIAGGMIAATGAFIGTWRATAD